MFSGGRGGESCRWFGRSSRFCDCLGGFIYFGGVGGASWWASWSSFRDRWRGVR